MLNFLICGSRLEGIKMINVEEIEKLLKGTRKT
jgi:hypothetical protein